jgi:hypothetical protein
MSLTIIRGAKHPAITLATDEQLEAEILRLFGMRMRLSYELNLELFKLMSQRGGSVLIAAPLLKQFSEVTEQFLLHMEEVEARRGGNSATDTY